MRLRIFLFFVFAPIISFAQIIDLFQDYQLQDSTQWTFGIRTHVFNNSTALTARVLNTAFYGGYIDTEQKNNILSRADEINTSGSSLNTSIYVAKRISHFRNQETFGLSVFGKIADRQENLAMFNDKALQLIFNGNKQFTGQTISLDPLEYNQFRYSQFQVGISKDFKSGNGFTVGASFLYGHNNRHITSDRMDILISETGDRLSTDAEFTIHETDPNNPNFFEYNGAGFSIDLEGRFAVQLVSDSSNPGTFHFSVSDLGFIQWHGTSLQTEVDTFYSFTGINIENIFDPNSPTTGSPQNLWDSISVQSKQAYILNIPNTIHFYLEQNIQKFRLTMGGAHRNKAYYYPYFYGKCGYLVAKNLTLTGQLNYGGYGKFGGGIEILHESESHSLKLGSTNIEGFLAPDQWAGQSIYFQIAAKL